MCPHNNSIAWMPPRLVGLLVLLLSLTLKVAAQADLKLGITPEELAHKMMNNPALQGKKGESFCWHARYGMDRFLQYYQLTGDTRWLDAGIRYYDFLIGKMETGPDGYRGWIGPYIYDNRYWIDSHVGDAILLEGILSFAVLVQEDEKLKKQYGPKAAAYAAIAQKHLIEKNDQRGTWKEMGPVGAYVSYSQYLEPGNLQAWKYGAEVPKSGMSHPFNKQGDIAQVCLRLYRITGNRFYFDRAEKIFLRMKQQLQLTGNHYEWNYWEPFGAWDLDPEKHTPRHWVGINPSAGYQAREVAQMVDAYHHGVVFDQTDMERLVNTHLAVMWNQDRENPAFTNTYVAHGQQPKAGEKPTGTLWTALMDFDQRIRDVYSARFKPGDAGAPEYLFFRQVTCRTPPGFKRKYARGPVKLPPVFLGESRDLRFAAVIPPVPARGEKALLLNHTWQPGELEIALYSADGKKKILTIYQGSQAAATVAWLPRDASGKQKLQGDYRIRWTLNNGYRECPITIR